MRYGRCRAGVRTTIKDDSSMEYGTAQRYEVWVEGRFCSWWTATSDKGSGTLACLARWEGRDATDYGCGLPISSQSQTPLVPQVRVVWLLALHGTSKDGAGA